MFNQERLEKLKRLFKDAEWKLVDEMLREYIEPLINIAEIDLSDTATSVKGEIRAKKQMYYLLDKFLKDAQAIAENDVLVDKRDSME